MNFIKYSGSGNDFIIFDQRQGSPITFSPTQIRQWCQRREGVGADGVILIEASNKADFSMRIFNADGSEAEMCGNGARCSVHMVAGKKINQVLTFSTMNGIYEGEVLETDEVRIKMTELYQLDQVKVKDLGQKNVMFLNTGVPHTVVEVSSVEDVNVSGVGRAIRHDVRFPMGTNVDFFEVVSEKVIKLRVYERGVEDETLCCGTGVMATAIACHKFFQWEGEILVYAKGGTLKAIIDPELKELYFQGKVQRVFTGSLCV